MAGKAWPGAVGRGEAWRGRGTGCRKLRPVRLFGYTVVVAADIATTRRIIADIGPILQRYRGGLPLGFFAAIASFESGGRMVAGDANLGEYGIFQVAANTPTSFGYPATLRTTVEGNVFLAGTEYAIEAVKMSFADPRIALGSEDSWKLGRLAFAIGSSGTRKLLEASRNMGSSAWQAVKSYVDTQPGMTLGSQSPAKVKARVHAVDDVWAVGQQAAPGGPGLPSIPPPPPGLAPPRVPDQILARMAKARSTQLFLVLALAAGGAWFYIRS